MVTDDPIGRIFKRGQLRRETAHVGKTAEAKLRGRPYVAIDLC
jgi:hypothetical protein